ncbi:MAG: hypothetical protein ABI861_08995 [Panacibacter sp.]
MNIYYPYEVLADTNDCLHLKQNESRERYQFILTRVIPIFLIMLVWFTLQQVGSFIPMGWNYLLVALVLFVAGLLFLRSYITEFKIAEHKELFVVEKTIFGSKEKNINRADIKNIALFRKRGKSSGAFFMLNVNPNKSMLLISIPSSNIDEHHLKLIKERLQDLLHVSVTEKG